MDHVYTIRLEQIRPGRLFAMVNYEGAYMRVQSDNLTVISGIFENRRPFNDDGVHVPIVEIATGRLTYMAKHKLCYLFPGEQP